MIGVDGFALSLGLAAVAQRLCHDVIRHPALLCLLPTAADAVSMVSNGTVTAAIGAWDADRFPAATTHVLGDLGAAAAAVRGRALLHARFALGRRKRALVACASVRMSVVCSCALASFVDVRAVARVRRPRARDATCARVYDRATSGSYRALLGSRHRRC